MYSFIVGKQYSKTDIYHLLKVPTDKQRGAWDIGYRAYNEDVFIFANIGIPGRTGHDYNNEWDGDLLVWEGNNASHKDQPLVQRMLNPLPGHKIYLFTRVDDRQPFVYEGTVTALSHSGSKPITIIWKLDENPYGYLDEEIEEVAREGLVLYEGGQRSVLVNKYERNPLARRMCIEHYGCFCNVCKFDFFKQYGEWGKNFIHIHHLIPISSLKTEYVIDPVEDLLPLCANCHSMVHRKKQMLSIAELKDRTTNLNMDLALCRPLQI